MRLLKYGLVLLLAAGLLVVWRGLRELRWRKLYANEHAAHSALRVLNHLQNDYLDGEGRGGYWTKDVAGLVALRVSRGPEHFPQTEAWSSVAPDTAADLNGLLLADPSLPGAEPYRGYWFVSVPLGDSKRYGFCAYPADYRYSGIRTFITGESRLPTARDLDGAPVRIWPSEAELQHWPSCISG